MLQNLSIQDFILIEKLDLDFENGFSVITGQTGAGKSILLDAIIFALGGKFGNEVIRSNQEKTIVTLIFSLNNSETQIKEYLAASGIDIDFNEDLVIKRIQFANGRKKFLINDNVVTQKVVFSIGNYLLEFYGQHQSSILLDISSHLKILDQFADNAAVLAQVDEAYKIWQQLVRELEAINKEQASILQEIDYLVHICKEFDELNLEENEEEKLIAIKKQLQVRDKELKLLETVIANIESTNIEQVIGQIQRSTGKSENFAIYEEVNNLLEEVYTKITEVKSALQGILKDFDLSDYNLAEIEDRLYAIKSLARKHNCHSIELPVFIDHSKKKLDLLKAKLQNSVDLNQKIITAKNEYFSIALLLSQKRVEAAKQLERKVLDELSMLEMPKVIFSVNIVSNPDESRSYGIDQVRFMASTNPGMPEMPIDQIASGGELSRFILGFRAALFDKGTKQTIIFDEIDVGIGGNVADSVGFRLKALSRALQVIVITHQPQVAGKADQHILVQKRQLDVKTIVDVRSLGFAEKSHELARMISGKEITDNAIAAAKELIG